MAENGVKQLPDGWELVTMENIGADKKNAIVDGPFGSNLKLSDYINGTDGVPVLTTKNLERGFENVGLRYISHKKFDELKRSEVIGGDILIAKIGSCGKTGIYPSHMPSAIIPANLLKITVHPSISRNFVYYYLNSPTFKNDLDEIITATAQPAFGLSKFKKLPFPLPPLLEQERIVSRIEELFSDLDAGVAALERVRAGLRRYKASVLKAAVSGKLVNGNSENGNGDLPEGWRIAKVEDIAETIGGVTKGRNFRDKKTVKLPYLRVANVQRGRLDLDEMKDIELLESEIEKYRLHDGDVVLTEGGDWDKLGRSAIWRNQIELCVHQNHIFRARVKDSDILPEWLMHFTNSEVGQDYFKEAAKQTTNLASINLTQLRNCPVHLPPLEEQRRIVAEVERRLSVVGEVESAVEAGLVRAARLRQSVLRSAFEGRL